MFNYEIFTSKFQTDAKISHLTQALAKRCLCLFSRGSCPHKIQAANWCFAWDTNHGFKIGQDALAQALRGRASQMRGLFLLRPRFFVFSVHKIISVINTYSLPGSEPKLTFVILINTLNNIGG